jgi:aspartyl-tRNA(Asn)/glutamyl-tRNA(Gln) amidotransferase subunit C
VYDFRQVFPLFSCIGALVTLTRRDVENIAHLARLEISEAELPVYVQSLSAILAFVEQLAAAPTEGVLPMAHPLEGQVQRLREDRVTESDHRDRYQANAPAVEAGLYLVPRVIE